MPEPETPIASWSESPMPKLRLATRITDLRTRTIVVRYFYSSPVTVGHDPASELWLDSKQVANRQGTLEFETGSLRYVEFGSASGPAVEGANPAVNVLSAVQQLTAIRIGPFEITAHMEEMNVPKTGDSSVDARPADRGMAQIAALLATRPDAEAVRWVVSQWPPSQLLARALDVLDILADIVVEYRPELLTAKRTPLKGSRTAGEVIAFLLDPGGGDESLQELFTFLVGILHPRLLGPHGGETHS